MHQFLTDIRSVKTGPDNAQYERLPGRDATMLSFSVRFLIDWDNVWPVRRF